MRLSRGVAALTLIGIFFLNSVHAEYLYKDDVVKNPLFTNQINTIGAELKAKTGISLYLVMLRDLDNNQTIGGYEKNLIHELGEPSVVLTFVEMKKNVDIIARPASLYKDFNKAQILSPSATWIGSVISALMFAHNFDQAKELIANRGGTVLPILADRAKGEDIVSKYSVAMFNGYSDTAEQIAAKRGIILSSAAGSGSKDFIDIIRVVFYGIILFAFGYYLKRRFFTKIGAENG